MTPLTFRDIGNQFTYDENQVEIDSGHLAQARAAMSSAVGVRKGLFVGINRRFLVRPFELGLAPWQGGVWRVSPIKGADAGNELIRFAVCCDPEVQTIIWTALHTGWDIASSRPVNAPPPLPWAAWAASDLSEWGGHYYGPFPGAVEHLAMAWWQLHEAGATGAPGLPA